MKRILITLVLLLTSLQALHAQEFDPLSARFGYTIEPLDTSLRELIPMSVMLVYTNDTLVRIENETAQLGEQVLIKHLELNKSYLLLNLGPEHFAIQTDHNKPEEEPKPSQYTYKKKWGKRKIAGLKAKRMLVSHPDFKEPMEFWYLPDYSPKYLDAFPDFPGLPVRYYLATQDGILVYTLDYFEEGPVERDYFGIPSDYQKISFDEFVERYLQMRSGQQMN